MAVRPLKRSSSSRRDIRLPLTLCAVLGGALLPGTQALAAGPPEAPITGACQWLVQRAGVGPMCGTLNPNTSEHLSSAYFLFKAGPSCIGGGREPLAEIEGQGIEVYGELTGLPPATMYTYCLVAANASGETSGQPVTFTTTAQPQIEPASLVTSTSAILNGTLEPAATRLGYRFWLSQAPDCSGGVGATPSEGEGEVSASFEGLMPNTEYTFCLVAKGREGIAFDGETNWGNAGSDAAHFRTGESQAEVEARERLEQEAKSRAEAAAKAGSEAVAAAARKQEEAAAEARRSEEAALAPQSKGPTEAPSKPVSLSITKVKVGATTATITLDAAQRGAVTVFGTGLKTTTKSVIAGTSQIQVVLTEAGKRDRKRHKRINITARLKSSGRVATGSKLVKL
jgi:hypothetical protein